MKNRRFWFILCCALALAIGVGATWALWPAPQQAPAVKPSSQDDYPILPIPPTMQIRSTSLEEQVGMTTLIIDATVAEVKPVETRVFVPEGGTGEKAIYDRKPAFLSRRAELAKKPSTTSKALVPPPIRCSPFTSQ